MDCRINHHRLLVRVGGGNLLVHLEEVTVACLDDILAKTLDCSLEIKEYCKSCLIYTESCIATLLSRTGSHVTRNEVSESRVAALKIVVPILLRNV